MRLIFSLHAKRRMRERGISTKFVRAVIENSQHQFLDTMTGYTVVVKRMMFREKQRFIAVSLDKTKKALTVVSVHPIRDRDFISRTESGRWI